MAGGRGLTRWIRMGAMRLLTLIVLAALMLCAACDTKGAPAEGGGPPGLQCEGGRCTIPAPK